MNTMTKPIVLTEILESEQSDPTVKTDTSLHTRLGWWLVTAGPVALPPPAMTPPTRAWISIAGSPDMHPCMA